MALIGVIVATRVITKLPSPQARRGVGGEVVVGLIVVLIASSVYLSGWLIHEQLLTQPGPGDAFYAREASLWTKHQTMLTANYNLTATHPSASHWWSWPLMLRAIFYWQHHGALIYFLGNPVVWWGAGLLTVVAAVTLFIGQIPNTQYRIPNSIWIPLAGFLIAFIPLIRVPRALFLYHYLTPLLFSLLFGLIWLDSKFKTQNAKRKTIGVVSALVLLSFILFSPLTYGFIGAPAWQETLFWLPGWR